VQELLQVEAEGVEEVHALMTTTHCVREMRGLRHSITLQRVEGQVLAEVWRLVSFERVVIA
jgi:hypothetical protein